MTTVKCPHEVNKYRCVRCDPQSYLRHRTRWRAERCIPHNRIATETLLGCDLETFKTHIESQFTGEMSWENKIWELDHVTPIKARLDGTKPDTETQASRFHYTNVRPVLTLEHRAKSAMERRQGLY